MMASALAKETAAENKANAAYDRVMKAIWNRYILGQKPVTEQLAFEQLEAQ